MSRDNQTSRTDEPRRTVMFFCQNFLGMGHLVRTTEILRSFEARAKVKICLVFGGETVPGFDWPNSVDLIELPALRRENGELKVVVPEHDLEDVKRYRQRRLLEVLGQVRPDCLVIEGFPFSKRALHAELLPLVEHARAMRPAPMVLCSLRDIILAKRRIKEDERARKLKESAICQTMNQYFDGLLFHSDPQVIRLEESFSRVNKLDVPIHYTGFVAQSLPDPAPARELLDADAEPTILVSVGGGRLGRGLLECLIETAPRLASRLPHRLLIFTGPFVPSETFEALSERAAKHANVVLRRYTPHLLTYMSRADLSISLCGYNTSMNLLRTGVRSLVMPSDKDLEQPSRAMRMAQHDLLEIIPPDDLDPERMMGRILRALERPPPRLRGNRFNIEGAQRTAEIVLEMLEQRAVDATVRELDQRATTAVPVSVEPHS
ncbi:MAG: glycosyltransferase [Myxococcota bacterium]